MTAMSNGYYSQKRDDILSLIPPDCRRVLDVGCGYGQLGKAIKERNNALIYGIEKEQSAEPHLEKIYDEFIIGDIENSNIAILGDGFDCIVFADVLEHLVDPWKTLEKYAQYLQADGKVIISVPNVRNIVLIFNLLFKGRWEYADSGLLDKGHLRFFTRKELQLMIEKCELTIETIKTNHDKYSIFKKFMVFLPLMVFPDLSVCQFIIRAKKGSLISSD